MIRLLLCLGVLLGWHAPVQARVERFALVIGNDRGTAEQEQLRYAVSDARRVADVLRELGGFEPTNVVLLRDEPAEVARRSLISINDRIRQASADPDTQVVLLVYYSGHGDADGLHLGTTKLPKSELVQLVRGSAATFRVLILDACRSGTVTRAKGGRVVDPFSLPEEELPGAGLAYLTASAADEDAQESDELRGSFFTQALVTALLGAADDNDDGAVSLEEAYQYAYDATLRASSETASGLQHPAFRYDLSGQGQLILTRPQAHNARRALVSFPRELAFLVMRESENGAVVAELRSDARGRSVSLAAGRYFVRGRGKDVLYEGRVTLRPGDTPNVQVSELERIEYAHLVRKGGAARRAAHALELSVTGRSVLPNAQTPCVGASVGYAFDLARVGFGVRLGACHSASDNGALRASTSAYDGELRAHHAWDFSRVSLWVGLGAGVTLFDERFSGTREAPDRTSLVPYLAFLGGLDVDLNSRLFLALSVAGETHFFRLQRERSEPANAVVSFAIRPRLGLGIRL